MREVKVSKRDLRNTLIQNKQDHEADFAITWKKYKDALRKRLDQLTKQAYKLEPGEPIELAIYDLPYPENHAGDYQRAIEMLEWEVGEEVVLSQAEFSQFVQDDWAWKHQFTTANAMYTGSVSPSKF